MSRERFKTRFDPALDLDLVLETRHEGTTITEIARSEETTGERSQASATRGGRIRFPSALRNNAAK